MQFSSYFILNREHFSECFEQSEQLAPPRKIRHNFIAALLTFGFLVLMFTDQSVAVGLFFIGLAFVEFFSFKYRKAWWLSRQMWSRNSGNKITLTIDDEGIKIDSLYQKKTLLWGDIKSAVDTTEGIMLKLADGSQSYLSKSSLNTEVITFIHSKTVKD